MIKKLDKKEKRQQRHKRIRAKMFGVANKPRVTIFISNRHLYAQAINDSQNKTMASTSDLELKDKAKKLPKVAIAKSLGLLLSEKLKKLKIKKIVFDRAGFKYHGRVKSFAEGLREGGIKF